ncbi:Endonuclease YncB precursor [compost metagenome]
MVNKLMLEQGYARVAVYPPDIKFEEEFKAIEKKTREAKLGVWSIPDYVTDNGFDAGAAAQP